MVVIKLNGIVQGIGFRPFVYRLARELNISGYVFNSSSGLEIKVRGTKEDLHEFLHRLQTEYPPAARIENIAISETAEDFDLQDFIIRTSKKDSGVTLVSPDLAVCSDCLRELLDSSDKRFAYPFINCTNCGPRYSIISDLPYDRSLTSMKDFNLCDYCLDEYQDPLNRRFHAQPVACPRCGPHLSLMNNNYSHVSGNPLTRAIELLQTGKILGIKGIGGFHIACDPCNQDTIIELRRRKSRPHKPFAVMCHPQLVSDLALVNEEQIKLLSSAAAPILILPQVTPFPLSPLVAPDSPNIGIIFPYAPLHYQLLSSGLKYLIMTSGNRSDEPVAKNEQDLGNLCDYYLSNDRPILNRSDDSVILPAHRHNIMVRRSRGYVPYPFRITKIATPILGCGAQLKLTFALAEKENLFLSPYIGNADSKQTFDFYIETLEKYKHWFKIEPQLTACDMQPDFMSTRFAEESGLPLVKVQHHHAHIAAVMAEHLIREPVLGIAYDGTGLGTDGAIWGGEIMLAEKGEFHRLYHLDYMPLPGGDSAIRYPIRTAFSYLHTAGIDYELFLLDTMTRKLLSRQLATNFNVFRTSSMGRLFDCISAILGLYPEITFEAQSAIALESICGNAYLAEMKPYEYAIKENLIDIKPMLQDIIKEKQRGISKESISRKFHKTVIDFTVTAVDLASDRTGVKKVVLCGGVMQNRILLNNLTALLEKKNYHVYLPREIPVNDGSIAAGQVYVASFQ